jgi:hypothetical protein
MIKVIVNNDRVIYCREVKDVLDIAHTWNCSVKRINDYEFELNSRSNL